MTYIMYTQTIEAQLAKEVWMKRWSWANIPRLITLSHWQPSVSLVTLSGHCIQPVREAPAVLPITGVHPKSCDLIGTCLKQNGHMTLFCLPWADKVWELTAETTGSLFEVWNPPLESRSFYCLCKNNQNLDNGVISTPTGKPLPHPQPGMYFRTSRGNRGGYL